MEMVEKIPLFYQWVMELIDPQCSPEETITIGELRDLIANRFKLGRPLVSPLLIEMKDMGLIEFYEKTMVRVVWKPEIIA